MAIQIPWTEQEAAVLLDTLVNVLAKKIDRYDAIVSVSKELRMLAERNGIKIDKKYRNENGIALQMNKLEYAFTGGKSGLAVKSGWYFRIVEVYRDDRKRFESLLGEVNDLDSTKNEFRDKYFAWLSGRETSAQLSDMYIIYDEINDYFLIRKLLKKPLFETTQLKILSKVRTTIEENKFFRYTHKQQSIRKMSHAIRLYITYVKELSSSTVSSNTVSAESNPNTTFVQKNMDSVQPTTVNGSNADAEERQSASKPCDINNRFAVSFSGSHSYSHTLPSDLEYAGKHYPVKNWKQTYVQIVKCLLGDFPDKIRSLMGKSFRDMGEIDIADTKGSDAMLAPRKIAEDLYLETNGSIDVIVIKARILLGICEIDYGNVIITYSPLQDTPEAPKNDTIRETMTTVVSLEDENLSFYKWLTETQGMAKSTGRTYVSAINTADAFARKHNIGHGVICGTSDWVIVKETTDALFQTVEFIEFNKRYHSQFMAALRKYIEYLQKDSSAIKQSIPENDFDAVDFTPYREILLIYFPNGFRISSRLDMGRFRTFWSKKYSEDLPENDDTVRKHIRHITLQYQDFVYLPETMLGKSATERLLAYLKQCFNDGRNAVYFDAIYKEFQEEFINTHINNSEMLKIYLKYINKGSYFIHRNYVTAIADAEVNPADEIRDYLITAGVPVTVEDLKNALSHIDEDAVYVVVSGRNSAEFVRNQKGEYFHADIIRFTQPEIDTITNLIQNAIDDKGYMGGKELTDAIKIRLPTVLERYPFFTWLGLRDVIAYKLRDVFSFKGKIISTYGQDLSMTDIFARFAATHEHFTLEQLKLLKRDLDTQIYFNAVYENSLRINKEEFVSRDKECFDIKSTDVAISRFCTGDYIALKEISFFGSFPDAGFPWNRFLLEHYVAYFSKKYKLLHHGFIIGTPVGAIVKRSSRFENFDELISAELAVSNIPLSIDNALQYLVDMGFLARTQYTGIERILSKAKLQRSMKG